MADKTMYILFVLLLVYRIEDVKCKEVYCLARRNEFYLASGDLCKKCDMCDPGLGLEPMEVSTFEVTLEHGAMGCRRCRRCAKGFHSNRRSYGKCKQCRDCEGKGKATNEKCTLTSNAKCGKRLPKENIHTTEKIRLFTTYGNKSTEVTQFTTTHPIVNFTTQTTDILRYNKTNIVLMTIFLVLVVALIVASSYLYIKVLKGKKKRRGDRDSQSIALGSTRQDDVDVDGEIPTVSDPFLGYSEVFEEYHRKCIILSDKQIMFVSKRIAANKAYRQVALDLDIPESDISILEEENTGDCISTAYKCLQKWTQLFPEHAYASNLFRALENIGRRDLIINFCKEYKDVLNNDICISKVVP